MSSTFKVQGSASNVRQSRPGGFTLIELMTVMAIIAVLAALTIGGAKYAVRKGAENRAKAEIHALETALEDFKADKGFYPPQPMDPPPPGNSTVLYDALAGTTGGKPYFNFKPDQLQTVAGKKRIIDPFGHEYNYLTGPTAHNRVTFDLWSSGPDGLTGTAAEKADDITNWQSN